MNQTAKSATGMLHLLGCAMFACPTVPREDARSYWIRLNRAVAVSGATELDPEAFKTTEEGKLLTEAASARIRLAAIQPDPERFAPVDYMAAYRGWLEQVILLAAGMEQRHGITSPAA